MNKTAGVSFVRRMAAGVLVAASLTSSFVASAAWKAGLLEGKAASTSSSTTVEPTSWTAVMSPVCGGVNGWAANQVFVYRGKIYLDGTKYWFAEKNSLWAWLKIDGEVVLNDGNWWVFSVGSITREAGWYDFEARFWGHPDDGRGPCSTYDKNGRLCGFGYMKGDTAPTAMTDCVYPEDDGSMSLFRYDDGTGFPGINVFGEPENLGEPEPGYGLHEDVTVGNAYTLTCPDCATNVSATIAYRCAGWELKVNDVLAATNTAENVRTCVYTCTNAADKAAVTWKWAVEKYKLDIVMSGEGTVDVESQWVEPGAAFTLNATPAAGQKFYKWTGTGFASGDTYRTNCTVTVSEPRSVTANFYDVATTPRVVRYVTPTGAGTKDGTSWENAMSSVATAYASAGANPSGGEVWVRYGTYNHSFIQMLPNITVRGGFAGGETLASEADPTNNPTIMCNGFEASEVWTGTDKPIWTSRDGRYFFNDPPDEGDASMYEQWRDQGDNYGFYRKDGGAIGKAEFHGLVFTRYWSSAVRVWSENDDPIVFRNCRFLRIGWLTNNDSFVVELIGTGVDMEDCDFVSMPSPVYVATKTDASPRRTATFKRCRFYTTRDCWNTASGYSQVNLGVVSCGVVAYRNVSLTVQECLFDRNVSTTSGSIYANACGDVLVEDTVVRRGKTGATENGGALGFNPKGDSKLTVRRCRFEKCVNTAGGTDHVNQGSAVGIWGSVANGRIIRGSFENTTFVANWINPSGKDNGRGSSCVCFGSNNYGNNGYCDFNFINCLFERNEAIHPLGGAAGTTIGNSWTKGPRLVFANCVFKDNVCGKVVDETTVYDTEMGRESCGLTCSFINTIFENANKAVLPWPTNQNGWVSCANTVTDTDVAYGKGYANTYRFEPLVSNGDAGLESAPLTNGVVVARRVSLDSAYRRKGRPLWLGTDDEIYLYDAAGNAAKPWRSCRYNGARLTDEEAAAIGVSQEAAPIPDAFGAARKSDKTALGNVNAKVKGLYLFFK